MADEICLYGTCGGRVGQLDARRIADHVRLDIGTAGTPPSRREFIELDKDLARELFNFLGVFLHT